jgi:hypothetical protein
MIPYRIGGSLRITLEHTTQFSSMQAEIRQAIARKIFQVRIRVVQPPERRRPDRGDARHTLLGQFGAGLGAAMAGAGLQSPPTGPGISPRYLAARSHAPPQPGSVPKRSRTTPMPNAPCPMWSATTPAPAARSTRTATAGREWGRTRSPMSQGACRYPEAGCRCPLRSAAG